MLVVTGIALFAAIFHLGRPLYAYKALKMWKRSWLSREVLLFALFSNFGAAYASLQIANHFWKLSLPFGLLSVIGGLVAFFGLAGIYASAKIYLVPARPAWNTNRTPLRFFLTGFILGPLFALVVYSVYSSISLTLQGPYFQGPAFAFLLISAISGLLQLVVLLARLFSIRQNESDELYGSTFLLIHRFKNYFISRLILLILGSFLLPFTLFHLLSFGNLLPVTFISFSTASFVFSLLGEFLGRYLFFVTVVPKNMPGSFFTAGSE